MWYYYSIDCVRALLSRSSSLAPPSHVVSLSVSSIRPTGKVTINHCDSSPKSPGPAENLISSISHGTEREGKGIEDAPSQFDGIDLFAHPNFPLLVQLVPETQKTVHESQVEAVFGAICQFCETFLVAFESGPGWRFRSRADVLGESTEGRNFERRGKSQRRDSIVEV